MDTQQEFFRQERLCDIIVCAQPQPGQLICGFVPGCQEYDRHIRKIPYLLHQKETVSVRQHDIQDCKVRFFGFGGSYPFRYGRSSNNILKSFFF